MSQRIVLVDDIDESDADETVAFTFQGTSYEIDLNAGHAAELRSALQPYIEAGRRTGGGRAPKTGSRSGSRSASNGETSKIRDWAKKKGIEVSDRGRVPGNVREQYYADTA